MKVIQKAIETWAMEFDGSIKSAEEVTAWANGYISLHPKQFSGTYAKVTYDGDGRHAHDYMLYNLHRNMSARPNDWVVRTPEGNFVSVKPDVFKEIYDIADDRMDWSAALLKLKEGKRVARAGWNGREMQRADMFIFLVPGSTFKVNRPPLLGIYPEGTEINYHGHIDMRTADGMVVPWLASQTDQLAEDWELVT